MISQTKSTQIALKINFKSYLFQLIFLFQFISIEICICKNELQ